MQNISLIEVIYEQQTFEIWNDVQNISSIKLVYE